MFKHGLIKLHCVRVIFVKISDCVSYLIYNPFIILVHGIILGLHIGIKCWFIFDRPLLSALLRALHKFLDVWQMPHQLRRRIPDLVWICLTNLFLRFILFWIISLGTVKSLTFLMSGSLVCRSIWVGMTVSELVNYDFLVPPWGIWLAWWIIWIQ